MYTVYIKLEKSWTESNRKSKATKNGNTRWHIHRQYAIRQQGWKKLQWVTQTASSMQFCIGGMPLRKPQFSSLNCVINSTFRKVFDTRSQDVVDICLEMFNCVSTEQTVAMGKTKYLKKVSNLASCCVRHLLLKPQKNWRPCKVL